jgi:hypothetical protein
MTTSNLELLYQCSFENVTRLVYIKKRCFSRENKPTKNTLPLMVIQQQ